MSKIKKIILAGMLLALLIICSRFLSFKSQILVISFSFIPIIISAILLGPKYTCLICALGDLIGAIMFPFGAYFVGFTITEGLSGLIYGLILYNKNHEYYEGKKLVIRLTISSFIVLILIGIFITGFMISTLYGKAYIAIISSRAIAKITMLPIQIIIMYLLNGTITKYSKKYLLED